MNDIKNIPSGRKFRKFKYFVNSNTIEKLTSDYHTFACDRFPLTNFVGQCPSRSSAWYRPIVKLQKIS